MNFPKPLIQQLITEESKKQNLTISVLRTDLIHNEISGNKWYKLKFNLEKAKKSRLPLVTFGGPYSNHIAATAAAGKIFKIKTYGIIRGEKVNNPTLTKAQADGMQLFFITREDYKKKSNPDFNEEILRMLYLNKAIIVPEGGNNQEGFKGSTEILEKNPDLDYICCACGTGTTLAGITASLLSEQKALGFPVLKNEQEIKQNLSHYLEKKELERVTLMNEYHFGGYAKTTIELIDFIKEFNQQYAVPLDYVYTGKLFYGVFDLVKRRYFPQGSRIMIVHTGGLQGNQEKVMQLT